MSALTTWLTGIADAIRAKDGTADPIDHADFPAKITAIPQLDTSDATAVADDMLYGKTAYGSAGTKLTGTGAYWQYLKTLLNAFYTVSGLPETMEVYAPSCMNFSRVFFMSRGVKYLTLTFNSSISNATNLAFSKSQLITLTLNGSIANVSDVNNMFDDNASLVTINGTPFDFTAVTVTTKAFDGCSALVNVAFAASTIKQSLRFPNSSLLSTASLLSIANGLHADSAPKTLTMHATSKTNADNLNVDNVDGVAVAGSAMTLSAFITGVKGWTIA